MTQRDDDIITEVLLREGRIYTNDPGDRGGPTKFGITLTAWQEFSENPLATIEELAALSERDARMFYRYRHIIKPRFDEIKDPYLRHLMIDAGVHHGTEQATQWLQSAAEVEQDGRIGDLTLAAVNARNGYALYLWVVAARVRLFGRLIGRDPELSRAREAGFNLQAKWAGGWNNRAAGFIEDLAQHLNDPT